jgi:tRNA-specific 2-thiouridylase
MKIAVLVSGGVDSSLALKLLKDQGHDLTAYYLKIWLEDELAYLGDCPWQTDLEYAQAVCQQLDVPLKVVSLQKEYWDRVVSYTIAQAKSGKTPNPDVLCNQQIKFGAFLDYLDTNYDKIASGHYAHISYDSAGKAQLCMTPDQVKDQTYFLSFLSQEQLSRLLFPIGHLDKAQVRALAQEYNLPTKDRKDSQGICFLGKLKFDEFLKYHLGQKEGNLVELETNMVMGKHKGFWFYTIGQRKGIRLGGGPWYVVDKDCKENIVYISRNYYSAEKSRDFFKVVDCNWIAGKRPEKTELSVKLRHGAQLYTCAVSYLDNNVLEIKLAERDQGIAPGQFAAFYDGKVCLGSGIIQQV